MSQAMSGDSYPAENYMNASYPRMQQYAGYFDETLSDDFSISDQESVLESTIAAETPAVELDRGHYLLNFSRHNATAQLYDYAYRPVSINLSAQLTGKFFMDVIPTGASPAVICYRRNLFVIGGSVTVPQGLQYLTFNDGEYAQIESTELLVSATETLEYSSVKLINVPRKGAQTVGIPKESKTEHDPSVIPLTPFTKNNAGPDYVSLPVEWKRLQFRVSTANNGRRKELQQHFYLSLRVIATLKSGQRFCILEARSEPIVVRGRSPRNFQPKSVAGSITSRGSRSTTVDSSLALSKSNSEPCGSFEHMALPIPNYSAWQGDLLSGNATESIAAHATSELEQYTLHRSPGYSVNMYDDEDYFGQNASRRSRGSAQQSPRTSPFSQSAYAGYPQQSSYEYFPPMTDTWSAPVETMYLNQIAPPLPLPADSRTKTPRTKPKRHYSNGRH